MKLTGRLRTIANNVSAGKVLCDVGTDHAFIPIALVEEGKIDKAIAIDIGEGPLAIAGSHIEEHNLADSIETRLSDGLTNYEKGQADCILISGMGGEEIMKILDEAEGKFCDGDELIVVPHTKIHLVRKYLRTHGFKTLTEEMIIDAGKYYTVIKTVYENGYNADADIKEDYFGKYLIDSKNPILLQYLDHEISKLKEISDYIDMVKETNNEMH